MSEPDFDIPADLAEKLRAARYVAVLTGAGVSAESGIPTFREAQTGLWAKYDPQELATPQAFQRNPQLVWEWYAWRRELVSRAAPNPAHVALAEIERRVPQFILITQNVDGLHALAGSHNVVELHGNAMRTKCFEEDTLVESWQETGEVPPRCPRCGGLLRPDVVWFGERLPEAALLAAQDAARHCDLFLSIGTSGAVEPAASLPFIALKQGATVVIVNPEIKPSPGPTLYSLSGPAGTVLPALLRAAWGSKYSIST
jgi:NAD-dependent deacetylase